jgi:drug/metabolite transporter superfamily protein YnfA
MSKISILFEFWEFLKERKKWWLAPIIIFLILFGTLIILTEGTAIAPFIYTIF